MFVSSINICNHSHNNNPTKQKTCPTIVSNLIYIFIDLNMSQLLTLIKTIYFSCSYKFIFVYMYKHVVKMSLQIQKIGKISHITRLRTC